MSKFLKIKKQQALHLSVLFTTGTLIHCTVKLYQCSIGVVKKTPTPIEIGMANQLDAVLDTKGEKSKGETSSLLRNEDQSTKPPYPLGNEDSPEVRRV